MNIAGQAPRARAIAGLGIAVLLHGLLLLAIGKFGKDWKATQDATPEPRITMVMVDRRPPPTTPVVKPAAPVKQVRKARSPAAVQSAPQAITALPPSGSQAVQAVVPQAPIDVDAAVKSAGKMQLEDDRPVAQVKKRESRRLTRDEQFGQDVAKSARADCRTAHADVGLLAPIFLVRDAMREGGCKW